MTEPQTPITIVEVKQDTAETLSRMIDLHDAMTNDANGEMSSETPAELMLEAINKIADRVYLIDQKADANAAQIESLTLTINDLVAANKALVAQLTALMQK